MAILNVQRLTSAGLAPVLVAAAGAGDKFFNDGKTLLHVKNAAATPMTVTIKGARPCSHGFIHDVTAVSVAAGETKIFGPFAESRFSDDQGNVSITYSAVTTVTVGVTTII